MKSDIIYRIEIENIHTTMFQVYSKRNVLPLYMMTSFGNNSEEKNMRFTEGLFFALCINKNIEFRVNCFFFVRVFMLEQLNRKTYLLCGFILNKIVLKNCKRILRS